MKIKLKKAPSNCKSDCKLKLNKTGNFLNLERKGKKIYIFVHPQKGVP